MRPVPGEPAGDAVEAILENLWGDSVSFVEEWTEAFLYKVWASILEHYRLRVGRPHQGVPDIKADIRMSLEREDYKEKWTMVLEIMRRLRGKPDCPQCGRKLLDPEEAEEILAGLTLLGVRVEADGGLPLREVWARTFGRLRR